MMWAQQSLSSSNKWHSCTESLERSLEGACCGLTFADVQDVSLLVRTDPSCIACHLAQASGRRQIPIGLQ